MKTLSGTILVADDDADIRDILKDTLDSLGARIVTAVNGHDCLERVEVDAPDVLLLDIEMPIKSGLQVLQELQQRGSKVTIIMITAYGTIERAVQAIKQGAYDLSPSRSISIISLWSLKRHWSGKSSSAGWSAIPKRQTSATD